MSDVDARRWKVPYQVPGSLGGWLVVHATSREDAINAAVEAHGKSRRLNGHGSGPDRRIRLAPRQRVRIQYGEPEPLAAATAEAGAA